MHPVLWGPIHWYGIMLALSFLAGSLYVYKNAPQQGLDSDKIVDLSIWVMISVMLGARLLFVISEWDYFRMYPREIIFSRSGFSSYGGWLLALPVAILYLRHARMNLWRTLDLFSPAIALGESIGRIGCFMNGCCYGRTLLPSEHLPWAVKFPYLDGVFQNNPVYRHPTQLYQSLFALILFLLLVSLNKRKRFDGETFWIYLILYSAIRFFIDFFREPGQDLMLNSFTLAQLISIGFFAFSIGFFFHFRSTKKP